MTVADRLAACVSEPRPKKDKGALASEPWTVERVLHLALAPVAIVGWAVALTALVRQAEAPKDIARESARAKLSVSTLSSNVPR